MLSHELDKETLSRILLIDFNYLFRCFVKPVIHYTCNARVHSEFLCIITKVEHTLNIIALTLRRIPLDPCFIVDLNEHLVEHITHNE